MKTNLIRRLEVLEAKNTQLRLIIHATQDRVHALEQNQQRQDERSLRTELHGDINVGKLKKRKRVEVEEEFESDF